MKYLLLAFCGIILSSCRKDIRPMNEVARIAIVEDTIIINGDSYTGPPAPIDSAFLLILLDRYPELK